VLSGLRREARNFRNSASFLGSNVSGSNASKSLRASGELLSNTLPSILNCCFMLKQKDGTAVLHLHRCLRPWHTSETTEWVGRDPC